jgi:pimeloyl-[acyl-carrier protein] methyl ester esterase
LSALYREVTGRGRRDLVLLHGWGSNLRVWDSLIAALAGRFRLIAIDLPGHGRSDWDPAAHTPAAQAWRVHETLAPLTTRYSLLGWSLGGQFALDLAAAMPAGIERLVLVATTPRFLAAPGWGCGTPGASLERLAAAVHLDPVRAVDGFLELCVRGCAARTRGLALAMLRSALVRHGRARPEALAWGLARLKEGDLRAMLPQVRRPSLVIAGRLDRITRPRASRALAAALPKGRYHSLAGAAHVPFLTHPGQFASLLRGFLRG